MISYMPLQFIKSRVIYCIQDIREYVSKSDECFMNRIEIDADIPIYSEEEDLDGILKEIVESKEEVICVHLSLTIQPSVLMSIDESYGRGVKASDDYISLFWSKGRPKHRKRFNLDVWGREIPVRMLRDFIEGDYDENEYPQLFLEGCNSLSKILKKYTVKQIGTEQNRPQPIKT